MPAFETYTVVVSLKQALLPAAAQDEDTAWRFAEALVDAGLDDPCVTVGLPGNDLSFTAQADAEDATAATELLTRAVRESAAATGLFDYYPGLTVIKCYPTELDWSEEQPERDFVEKAKSLFPRRPRLGLGLKLAPAMGFAMLALFVTDTFAGLRIDTGLMPDVAVLPFKNKHGTEAQVAGHKLPWGAAPWANKTFGG